MLITHPRIDDDDFPFNYCTDYIISIVVSIVHYTRIG